MLNTDTDTSLNCVFMESDTDAFNVLQRPFVQKLFVSSMFERRLYVKRLFVKRLFIGHKMSFHA